MKVLIVDDHILFRDGLVSLLSGQPKYQVVGEAGSVSEAVQKASQLKPDLILMDYNLPDGTGLEATRAILALQPDCKIIFLTVEGTDESLFEALRSGAKGYVLKNVTVAYLLSSLEAMERDEIAISPAMTTQLVKEFSRTTPQPTIPKTPIVEPLSPREIDILRELSKGLTNQEIAERLFLSENTVKHHIHSILSKLGLKNRHAAAEYARQHGIL